MPRRLVPTLLRLARRVGRRGYSLLFFAALGLGWGFALAHPQPGQPPNPTVMFAGTIVPLMVWAYGWLATGLICMFQAFKPGNDNLGFAAVMFMSTAWTLVNIAAWVVGISPLGWLGATIWALVSGWTAILASWPDPTRDRGPA